MNKPTHRLLTLRERRILNDRGSARLAVDTRPDADPTRAQESQINIPIPSDAAPSEVLGVPIGVEPGPNESRQSFFERLAKLKP